MLDVMFEMGQPFLSTDTHTHCKINGNCFLINKGGLMFEYRQFPIVWCTKSNLNVNSVQSKHFLGVSKWRIIQQPLSNEWIWTLKVSGTENDSDLYVKIVSVVKQIDGHEKPSFNLFRSKIRAKGIDWSNHL